MVEKSRDLDHIFNCGETGIFWKTLQRRTPTSKFERTVSGHKISKRCITGMMCKYANAKRSRSMLLVLHNAPAHPSVIELLKVEGENVEILFLPPNVTFFIQPMTRESYNFIHKSV